MIYVVMNPQKVGLFLNRTHELFLIGFFDLPQLKEHTV